MITIYRCQSCGKWSHAARKPKHHQRAVVDDGQNDPDESSILSYEEGWTDTREGEGHDGYWTVKCGPFDTYEAVKIS